MADAFAAFEVEKLSGSASFDGRAISARIAGAASQRDIAALESFLGALLDEARRTLVGQIIVDVRDVAYMNSSHFKALVSWLGRVGQARPPIALRILGNADYHWQKRSLDALRHLAADWVVIEA